MAENRPGTFVRIDPNSKERIDDYANQMNTTISAFTKLLVELGLHHWEKAMEVEPDLRTLAEILLEKKD